jgi:ribosomal protein S18 acetylase RimI-like enzyme
VIRPENDASLSLYKKLGFKKHYQTVRAILRPHGYDDANDAPGGGRNDDDNDNTVVPLDD